MLDLRPPRLDPVSLAWNSVATYTDYERAQQAVDTLSDEGFPVENLDIVGSDLRIVERVTGRLTTMRAAMGGASGGAWFGLLVGLLLALFTSGTAWFAVVLSAAAIGAVWGGLFGFAAHAATRGRRDFSSMRSLAASRYDVIARGGTADRARALLEEKGLLA